jgi:hypothetical protein
MPEWIWWVLGGIGVLACLYLLVSLIILVVAGSVFTKVWDHFWDLWGEDDD